MLRHLSDKYNIENLQYVDDYLGRIIKKTRSIAVVGLSRDPNKVSFSVAEYLRAAGYLIIPINPMSDEIMGLQCYPSLSQIPDALLQKLDMVDVFRRSEDTPPIVDEAVRLHSRLGKPEIIWMQSGIVNEEAAKRARNAGLDVVMDKCLRTEHKRTLFG